jgi:uncharacterized HhH-GPD family protein
MRRLQIAQEPVADRLLSEDPFALVLGMLLDQQYPMEHAFRGAAKLESRLSELSPAAIVAINPEDFAAICAKPPAVHRFPSSMAKRIQGLAAIVVQRYRGDAAQLWQGAGSAEELIHRLTDLPGFGRQKAQIFLALLAKQFDVRPIGWETVAGDYALDGYRSVADVVDLESLQRVRDFKKQQKAAARAKADRIASD